MNEQAVVRPDRTQAGSFIGTVTYAAPEQILGAADIDYLEHRTMASDMRILMSTAVYVLRAFARH